MAKKIGAVITGGDFQGLGVLRTLARKGIPIVLLDNDSCIGRFSRFRKKFIRSPHPADQELYIDFLLDLVKKEGIEGWVIFPNSDNAVHVLSRYKDSLEEYYRVPTPGWDVIKKIYVKKNTYLLAAKHGIETPKTYYPKNLDELLSNNLDYPLVLKPSIRDNFYNKIKIKAFRINNRDELIKTYQRVCQVIDPSEVLVQNFIAGGPDHLYSFCPFFKDGKIVASVTARRARQHPMDFGHASTFAELVDIPEIREISGRFLRLIDYYGIGEVEFMFDASDNKYKLIEMNPRVWGWHTIAIAAGVDLPYFLYLDMLGEKVDAVSPAKDIKWVRLTTDIPTVLTEFMKGRMKIGDYFSSMRGKKTFAVFSSDDPLPFFAELFMIPYLWAKRGF